MNRPRTRDTHLPRAMYLRHGAYYFVRRGKWERLSTDLPQALKLYADRIGAPAGSMAELIDTALLTLRKSDGSALAASTVTSYAGAARKLKKAFEEFTPGEVLPRHVLQFKRSLAAKSSFANTCLTVLRLTFAYALEQGLVEINPVAGVKPFRQRKRDRLLSAEELLAIYQQSSPQLQIIIDLCIRTGQRIGDVLAIRRADLLPEGIRFKPEKTIKKKGTVPWTPELRAVVDRAKGLWGNIVPLTLLRSRRGRAPGYASVADSWRLACRKAGVQDAHIHDLRAYAATAAQRQGLDAQALLMHASAAQTATYLRDKDERLIQGPSFGVLDNSRAILDNPREKGEK